MAKTFEEVVAEVRVQAVELETWIEQQWVLPAQEADDWLFDEADVARVRLIAELRRDLDVNEEALPLVLNLLDQVYDLRRRMQELQAAINGLPADAREELEIQLQQLSEDPNRR